jgi:serine/threonine-protein kinase
MPAHVKLTITRGPSTGGEFVFDERTTCLIGRASDCQVMLPSDEAHRPISRHHCLLDINPPDVRIRDFGSLNGTRINGKTIGRRPKGHTPEEAAQIFFPEHDLKHGDKITLGTTLFRVDVYVPPVCTECACEIAEDQRASTEIVPGIYRCIDCSRLAQTAHHRAPRPARTCVKCGRDVAEEVGSHRVGDYVCKACKADPGNLLRRLLDLARTGQPELRGIDGYHLAKKIGQGGMGAVYLARHERSGEQVALKVMLPIVAAEQRAVQLFLRETENTKALRHERIVELRDAGCFQGVFYFTLELCLAGSVAKLMKRLGRTLSPGEAVPLILETLEGLEYAHSAPIPFIRMKDGSYQSGRGLVHRDLKPHNIFLHRQGRTLRAKIGDFGLAKAFDLAGLSGQTRSGDLSGTPHFIPREQVLNFKCSKPPVDVWATAATLYFMLTGAVPRDFDPHKDVWQTVLDCDAVPIRRRDASVPKRLAEVIDTALVEKPQIGFQSAREFRSALEAAL